MMGVDADFPNDTFLANTTWQNGVMNFPLCRTIEYGDF